MIEKLVLKFCFVSFIFAFSCCTEEKELQQELPGNDKTETEVNENLGSTNVVMNDGTALDVELNTMSKITFTEGQMVIKTNGKRPNAHFQIFAKSSIKNKNK